LKRPVKVIHIAEIVKKLCNMNPISCRAFAHNDFKRSILAVLRRTCMNVAAIEADGQRHTWLWQFVPPIRASLEKRKLFLAQLCFEAFSDLMDVTRDG
jgi:hypothetical protein